MTVKRIPNDAYYTPDWVTDRFIDNFSYLVRSHQTILEPCCGTGAMVERLSDRLSNPITSTDLTMGAMFDATTPQYWKRHDHFDWVITNPPFNHAARILEHALMNSQYGVAFLLRLSFLEPCPTGKTARHEVLSMGEDRLRFCLPLNPRPKFRKDVSATDSVTSAWFIWLQNHSWADLDMAPPIIFQ